MKYIVVIMLLLVASSASAQEPSRVRYKLPQVENVGEQKCLSTDQWQQVLRIASEYKGLFDWRLKIEPTLLAYDSLRGSYDRDIGILERQLKILKDDRDYLQLRLGQAEEGRLRLRKSAKLEKGIMWGVIAIETVVIGILGIKGTAN